MRLRYGIRSLLAVCVVVAAFFPFRSVYEEWFRSSYPGYHVHKTLRDFVKDGDTFESVASLFDRSEPKTKQWIDKHAPVLANRKSIFANHENGDTYYVFFIHGGNTRALFQFRNGNVVNHLKGLYNYPYSAVQHYKDSSPYSLFRHGALPVYTALVIFCGIGIWLYRKFTRHTKSTRDNKAMDPNRICRGL